MRRHALVAAAALLAGCGSESPSQSSTPVAAAPAPTPTPTPAPTPTPSPAGAPFVSATVRVLGFSRSGERYDFIPAVFRPGDTIDLDCTPRDADGRSTPNHPPFAEWYPTSTPGGPVIARDYTMARDNTFQPDLFIRAICPTGNIEVYCRVGTVNSNRVTLPVRGN